MSFNILISADIIPMICYHAIRPLMKIDDTAEIVTCSRTFYSSSSVLPVVVYTDVCQVDTSQTNVNFGLCVYWG